MNHTPADAEVEGIARELEKYIALHPCAADTPEGIARWWLDRREQPALNGVVAALERLIGRGVLVKRPLPDGQSLYARALRRNPTS